jgi:hypothetical protein
MNNDDPSFQTVSWTTAMPTGEARGWRGFERMSPAAAKDSFFERFERVGKALAGETRAAGLDLISRGGLIEIRRLK